MLEEENMKIKTSFPVEMVVIDCIAGLFLIGFVVYYLLCGQYDLIIFPSILASFFALLTFLCFLFSRFFVSIDEEYVEIRKFFKVKKYELDKCRIVVDEKNKTQNGLFIYILIIEYEKKIVLKKNSNSFDSDYMTKEYASKLQSYNKK